MKYLHLPNLFNKQDTENIIARVRSLTPNNRAFWGKMSVDQMCAHCTETFKVATNEVQVKRGFLSFTLGPLLKRFFLNEKELRKNSPTHTSFIITDSRNLELEKEKLVNIIMKFSDGGAEKVTSQAHVFFGKLTPRQWARGMYKHMDHHLKQFGV